MLRSRLDPRQGTNDKASYIRIRSMGQLNHRTSFYFYHFPSRYTNDSYASNSAEK